jgi:hypothetical protein
VELEIPGDDLVIVRSLPESQYDMRLCFVLRNGWRIKVSPYAISRPIHYGLVEEIVKRIEQHRRFPVRTPVETIRDPD